MIHNIKIIRYEKFQFKLEIIIKFIIFDKIIFNICVIWYVF